MAAISSLISGGLSLAGGFAQADAAKAQGEYQSQQLEFNAKLSELQAEDAIRRGDKASEQIRKETKQVVGSQRAALAAQGIEVDSDTAAEIQNQTREQGAMDAVTVKNNAWREAWGHKVQAQDSRSKSVLTKLSAKNEARNSLVTGGLNAINSGVSAVKYFKD